jgi:hypothetical protein
MAARKLAIAELAVTYLPIYIYIYIYITLKPHAPEALACAQSLWE